MIIRSNVNGKAKKNRKRPSREEKRIRTELSACQNLDVTVTTAESAVRRMCMDWMREPIDIALLSGGDGIVEFFMTSWFREQYRKYGRKTTPTEFASRMNAMALDPASRVQIPAIHQIPKGTVCYYADILGNTGDLTPFAEQVERAETQGKGIEALKRTYIPVFMIFNTDNPNDLEEIHIGTTYADGFIERVFREYYKPKNHGKDVSLANAVEVIGRTSASVLLDRTLPADSIGGRLYRTRYINNILEAIQGKVTLNENTTIIEEGQERNAIAAGCMGVNLYGLKPFYRVPASPDKFVFYKEGEREKPEELDIKDHMLHVFAGRVDLLDTLGQLPNPYMGKESRIQGITDKLARRIDIDQETPLRYIIDGEERRNGTRATIMMAYLQPFLLPEFQTNDRKKTYLQRIFYQGMERAQAKIDEILGRE